MHSPRFLYDIHGIRSRTRTRPRSRCIEDVRAALLRLILAIKTELRARRGAAELAKMDDHMLSDIGISRGEIESVVRRSSDKRQSSASKETGRNSNDNEA